MSKTLDEQRRLQEKILAYKKQVKKKAPRRQKRLETTDAPDVFLIDEIKKLAKKHKLSLLFMDRSIKIVPTKTGLASVLLLTKNNKLTMDRLLRFADDMGAKHKLTGMAIEAVNNFGKPTFALRFNINSKHLGVSYF